MLTPTKIPQPLFKVCGYFGKWRVFADAYRMDPVTQGNTSFQSFWTMFPAAKDLWLVRC